jgi:hypothetical protein
MYQPTLSFTTNRICDVSPSPASSLPLPFPSSFPGSIEWHFRSPAGFPWLPRLNIVSSALEEAPLWKLVLQAAELEFSDESSNPIGFCALLPRALDA